MKEGSISQVSDILGTDMMDKFIIMYVNFFRILLTKN